MTVLSSVAGRFTAPGDPNLPRSLPGAAREFEALLVGQMLKSAAPDWGCGEDEAGGIAREFAQEQLARALASRGGFGIAGMVTRDLSPPPKTPGTSPE